MPGLLRNFPSVNDLLESPRLKGLLDRMSSSRMAASVRTFLDDLRREVRDRADEMNMPTVAELADRIARRILREEQPPLRPTINATGILIHSGLGRAPLAEAAIAEMVAVARNYASVEIDLSSGRRSPRVRIVESLLRELTGAEAAAVVNNNAAATIVTLSALAAPREVIVARGQLIEIGNSYRLPDVIAASGAMLREVGTTNRTRLEDYARAIDDDTAAIMRVQPTNYDVVGMAQSVGLDELVQLGQAHEVPVIDNLGSAALVKLDCLSGANLPVAAESIKSGADLVLMSGDKLLGGPQCGIIVGRKIFIERIVKHPLMRAVRVGKLTLSALFATLRLYREPAGAESAIPLLQLMSASVDNLRNRAERLAPQLAGCAAVAAVEPIPDVAYLAGGSVPTQRLPTWCVALTPATESAENLAEALRVGVPSVMGRVEAGRVLLDLRSVFPRQDQQLVEAVAAIATSASTAGG